MPSASAMAAKEHALCNACDEVADCAGSIDSEQNEAVGGPSVEIAAYVPFTAGEELSFGSA